MSNILLHAGAQPVEFQRVLDSRAPQATRSHQPVEHSWLVALVLRSISEQFDGLKPTKTIHALSHEDQRYFGLFSFAGPEGSDHGFTLGLRNSHDKAFAAGVIAGASVFVCDNLCFSGEHKLSRKHTTNIYREIPSRVNQTIARLPEASKAQDLRFDRYKQHGLSPTEANDVIIKAYEAGAISSSRIGEVVKEYREPRHPEFSDRNAWSLFNAFTEIQKKTTLQALPTASFALQKTFDAHTGVLISTEGGESIRNN